jgi:transposase
LKDHALPHKGFAHWPMLTELFPRFQAVGLIEGSGWFFSPFCHRLRSLNRVEGDVSTYFASHRNVLKSEADGGRKERVFSRLRGASMMMGTKERSFAPLIQVSLEELVPQDHFYRHLERTLDLSFVREFVHETYAGGGRPSIDPVVFFKLQLVMFFEDIRSERLLMKHAADRLSVRWYLGYDFNESLPDHSSLSKIRTRYGLEVFRRFFDAIVEQCRQAKLVWGKELYIDSTQVKANADLDSLTPRFAVEAREAIQQHLTTLFAQETLQQESTEGTSREAPAPEPLPESTVCPLPTPLPVVLSDAQREELSVDNAARHDWIAQEGQQQREVHGLYQRTADFRISTTDPDATPMRLKSGGTHLGYHTHYVVDGGKARIILQVLVTPSEVMDNQPMRDLIFRTRFRWKLRPRHVTGDTTYGTIQNIKAIEDANIRAYVPLPDWDHLTAYYGPSKFTYDAAHDRYLCPQGQSLHRFRTEYQAEKVEYRAAPATCNACPLKAQCTSSDHGRQLHRSFHASYLERVQSYHQTPAYHKAMRKRQVWVEPLFAEAKDWHGMRRFRLRRLWRVNCEALMTASGQNLKRLLKKRGWGRRPWPQGAAHALSEPPAEEAMHRHASVRAEKALACEEPLHVKALLQLASSIEPLASFPSSPWRPFSLFFSPQCHQFLFVSPFLCLVWISPALFLHKAGHWRLEVTKLCSL